MSVSQFATRHLKAIIFVTLVLCGVGAWMIGSFPVSILPDVTFPRIIVIANAGDRPARMMEVGITRPIEQAIAESTTSSRRLRAGPPAQTGPLRQAHGSPRAPSGRGRTPARTRQPDR